MTKSGVEGHPRGLLNALGLHRKELRAWAMYDWGISAMQTTITTAIFPLYFISVAGKYVGGAAAEQQWYPNTIAVSAVIVAVLAPILGALADFKAAKKKFLVGFMLLGVSACAAMFFIAEGQILFASIVFVLSLIGATGSMTFYESLLPHIADESEMDRVSTAGYALGYIGGGVLLALNLWWIMKPAMFGLPHGDHLTSAQATLPSRLAFLSVAVWWLVFSVPVLRHVPEPPRTLEYDETSTANALKVAFTRLRETVLELRQFRQAFLVMLAFTIYNDGIQTVVRMATPFGKSVGVGQKDLIAAILLVQFIGVPCAFLFGMLAGKVGAKRSVMLGLLLYTLICIFAYRMTNTWEFYALAVMVGLVQGGTQALSRSLFANMVPKHKSGEFFGFFSIFEKFGGILGPLLWSVAAQLTGSTRTAILAVIAFFVVGGGVLLLVNVPEGERLAREADARLLNA